jgi:uncharacterized protein YodC (DUF2158 family)
MAVVPSGEHSKKEISMSEQLKKGDTVKLKSGGPVMTIKDIGDYANSGHDDAALCVWFVGLNKVEDVFDLATLTPTEPSEANTTTVRRVVRS